MELLELEENAMVRTPSGEAVGEIERYVIDPSSRRVSHLVVKQGVLFTEERLLPAEWIDRVTEEGPVISKEVDPDDLQPFQTEHHVPMDQVTRDRVDPRLGRASIWRYPTIGTGFHPAYFGEPIPYRSIPDTTRVREVNVADEQAVVDERTPVESFDGREVGSVVEVAIGDEGEVAYLVVSFHDLDEDRVVPGHWIDAVSDDRVILAVADSALPQLASVDG